MFARISKQCMSSVKENILRPGQSVVAYDGGVISVIMENLTGHEKYLTREQIEKRHKFVVTVESSLPHVLTKDLIGASGSTALEAVRAALNQLESQLCPHTHAGGNNR
jgi:hypothetical protein